MSRHIIYPEKRIVSNAWIIQQAKDYLATEYMRKYPNSEPNAIEENSRISSVEQAVEILEDAGLVTFKY